MDADPAQAVSVGCRAPLRPFSGRVGGPPVPRRLGGGRRPRSSWFAVRVKREPPPRPGTCLSEFSQRAGQLLLEFAGVEARSGVGGWRGVRADSPPPSRPAPALRSHPATGSCSIPVALPRARRSGRRAEGKGGRLATGPARCRRSRRRRLIAKRRRGRSSNLTAVGRRADPHRSERKAGEVEGSELAGGSGGERCRFAPVRLQLAGEAVVNEDGVGAGQPPPLLRLGPPHALPPRKARSATAVSQRS